MTRNDSSSCVICGESLSLSKLNENRSSKRISNLRTSNSHLGQEFRHWKRDCAQSLIEILFGSKTHCLLNYFETDGYCPGCLQQVRDVDFNLRKIKALANQLDILSRGIRKNISFNYGSIKEKSNDKDLQTRLSLLKEDESGIDNYSNEQILEVIYSDMLVGGQNVLGVIDKIGKGPSHDKVSAFEISDDDGGASDGHVDLETVETNVAAEESTFCTVDVVYDHPHFVIVDLQDQDISNEVVEDKDTCNKTRTIDSIPSSDYGVNVLDIKENTVLLEVEKKGVTFHASQELVNSGEKEDDDFEEVNSGEKEDDDFEEVNSGKKEDDDFEEVNSGEKEDDDFEDNDWVDDCVESSDLSSVEKKCDPTDLDDFQNTKTAEESETAIPNAQSSSATYECRLCFEKFKCQQDLNTHLSIAHEEQDPYRCTVCKLVCSNSIVLSLHTKTCHRPKNPKKLHRCDLCETGYLFSTFEDMQIHKEKEHNNKCTLCSEVLSSKSNLSKHLKNVHNTGYFKLKVELKGGILESPFGMDTFERSENPHACKICGKSFKTMRILNSHEKVHTGEKSFECDICGKGFVKMYDLKKHLSVHTGEGLYRCYDCDLSFSTADDFRSHQRSHTGQKEYPCETCGKRFALRFKLKQHQNIQHDNRQTQKKSPCPRCGKIFRTPYLKKHMKSHEREKNHPCNFCDQHFSTLNDLSVHLKSHNKDTTHVCRICDKVYLNLDDLKAHEKRHTEAKLYKCDVCDKWFSTLTSKKNHQNSHTKPFQCDTCGKGFSQAGNLSAHIRTHTGEKPYQCPFCDRRFAESGTCKDHIRTHTGEKPFSCNICGKSFSQHRALNRHRKIHSSSPQLN